jgi:ribokinase
VPQERLPRRPRLTVVGSLNVDLVARVEKLPLAGETVTASRFDYLPGGKGANQAAAAARLGADVRMNGCVGSDRLGTIVLGALSRDGVDVSEPPVYHVCGDTGLALISVAESGENQIVVVPGANAYLEPDDLDLGDPDGILAQLEIPVETVEAAAAATDAFFCLNAAPAKPIPRSLVERCDLVVVNRFELDALPTTPRLTALTLGEEGAVLLEGRSEVARAQPPQVDAVDETAAGDAFTACLVVSHLEERSWEDALRRACAAGALAASRAGAQPSLPTAAEVDEILGG